MTNNRRRNIKPTAAELRHAWLTIKDAAAAGDVVACAELIKLDMLDKQADPLHVAAAKGDKTAQGCIDTIEALTEALELAQAIIAGDK